MSSAELLFLDSVNDNTAQARELKSTSFIFSPSSTLFMLLNLLGVMQVQTIRETEFCLHYAKMEKKLFYKYL